MTNETDPVCDILLCPTTYPKHLATSSLSRKHLGESPYDIQMVQALRRKTG